MNKLSEAEREAWRRVAGSDHSAPPLSDDERFVAPTVEARARYIRFATEAARFYHGPEKPPMTGNHWRL